jgi:hypothetical protein
MIPARTYSFAHVSIFLGGREIVGFMEDGITITPVSDFAESVVGADGGVVVSETNDERHECVLNMMEGSLGFKDLADLFEIQRTQNPKQGLEFIMEDYVIGDKISERSAFFTGRPALTKAKGVTARVWKLILPNPLIKYAEKVVN